MSEETLHEILKKTLGSPLLSQKVILCWHAGEPLSVGLDFYKKVPALIETYNIHKKDITQSFQTNATLIDDAWCEWFKKFNVSIGVSIDGPEFIHDASRRNWANTGSFKQVMRGINLLQKHKIPFTTISVLTKQSIQHAHELFNFFYSNRFQHIAFNFEEQESHNKNSSLCSKTEPLLKEYKAFFSTFYDLWLTHEQPFEIRETHKQRGFILKLTEDPNSSVGNSENSPLEIITFTKEGDISTYSPELASGIESNKKEFTIGNIFELNSLEELVDSEPLKKLSQEINNGILKCAETCSYFNFCGGGSPSNKYFENKTFNSTETFYCRFHKQAIVDLMIEKLEPKSELIANLKIHNLSELLQTYPDRIKINSGTLEREGIFIPKNTWRNISESEINALDLNDTDYHYQKKIEIIKIPDDLLSPMLDLSKTHTHSESDYKKALETIEFLHIKSKLLNHIYESYLFQMKGFFDQGLNIAQPSQFETTTINKSTQTFTGLHLDSWDRLETNQRSQARNRICINIGSQDRWLLFINLSLSTIFHLSNIPPEETHFYNQRTTELIQLFMKNNPNYPVLKLCIRPGEAYLAPTENMIHDGCNLENKNLDISWTFLGYFGKQAV